MNIEHLRQLSDAAERDILTKMNVPEWEWWVPRLSDTDLIAIREASSNDQVFYDKVAGKHATNWVLSRKVDLQDKSKKREPFNNNWYPNDVFLKIRAKSKRRKLKEFLFNGRSLCPCCFCGKLLTREEATFEHVIPASLGGKINRSNIRISCRECNSARGVENFRMFLLKKQKETAWKN